MVLTSASFTKAMFPEVSVTTMAALLWLIAVLKRRWRSSLAFCDVMSI